MHPKQIPLTPQTDPANFPVWEGEKAAPGHSGHRYPKQLTRLFTAEDVEPWRISHRKFDKVQREEYWEERCPKVGDPVPVLTTLDMVMAGFSQTTGQPVECATREDEEIIRDMLGMPSIAEEAKIVSVPIAESAAAKLKRENDELEAELERNAKLKAAKAEQQADRQVEKPKRKGWPKGKPRGKKVVPLAEFAESDDE